MAKERNNRKMYKYKYKPRKKRSNTMRLKSVFYVLRFILLLCILVILGYTLAGPVIKILHKNDKAETASEISTSQAEINVITNVTDYYDLSEFDNDSESQKKNNTEDFSAVRLSSESLKSEETFEKALEAVKKEDTDKKIKNVVIPMKSTGGEINFFSENKDAVSAKAVVSDLKADEIYSKAKSFGYEPIAEIGLLEDSIYSKYNVNAAFTTKSGSRWIDNSLEAGGKSWLDPSKKECTDYIESIADEIVSAGFKTVLCKDVFYPKFRQSDISYLGDEYADDLRYKNLTNLLSGIKSKAMAERSFVYVQEDAIKYISGNSEIIKKESLKIDGIVFNIDFKKIRNEEIKTKSGDILDVSDMTDKEAADAIAGAVIKSSEISKFDIAFEYSGKKSDENKLYDISQKMYYDGYMSYILNKETE